jgi:hypothetical protein
VRAVLQFHEDHVAVGVADVVPGVLLGVQPAHLAGSELDVVRFAVHRVHPPLEGAEDDEDAVGVLVRRGPHPRLVGELQHADAIVLEDDLVVVGVGDRRVEGHGGLAGHGGASGREGWRCLPGWLAAEM